MDFRSISVTHMLKRIKKPSSYIRHVVGYMFKQFVELLVRKICKTNFKVCSKCLVTLSKKRIKSEDSSLR